MSLQFENESACEQMTTLYGVLRCIERLEHGWSNGLISNTDYTTQCQMLLRQFNASYASVKTMVPNLREWAKYYRLPLEGAIARTEAGSPATMGRSEMEMISDIGSSFMACTDIMVAFPDNGTVVQNLRGLIDVLSKVRFMPPDWAPKARLQELMVSVSAKDPIQPITEEESRRYTHAVQEAATQWQSLLKQMGGGH